MTLLLGNGSMIDTEIIDQLENFILSTEKRGLLNQWLRSELMKVYVRKSIRYIVNLNRRSVCSVMCDGASAGRIVGRPPPVHLLT